MAREALGEHFGKRMTFRGFAAQVGTWTNYNNYRTTPTRCIQRLEIDGRIIADHAWLNHAGRLKDEGVKVGDYIEFEAEVTRYTNKKKEEDFTIDHPTKVWILDEATEAEFDGEPGPMSSSLFKPNLTVRPFEPPVEEPVFEEPEPPAPEPLPVVRAEPKKSKAKLMSDLLALMTEHGEDEVGAAFNFLRN